MAKVTEGYMPFLGYKTYYRIVGERKDNGKAPLVFLHGGPGSTHNYFEVLDCVTDMDDRQLIMYDQIGCGKQLRHIVDIPLDHQVFAGRKAFFLL